MRHTLTVFAATTGLMLLSPSTATAGGVGITMGAGLHQDRAYYYRDDGAQGVDKQTPTNTGIGGELLLGDRDDRIIGLVRGYISHDAALTNPDPAALGEDMSYDYVYPDVEAEGSRNVGAAAVGIQWSLWGDPTGFQLIANSLIGSGFWTSNNLEYALFVAGVGVTYTMNERFQLMGSIDSTTRYRKRFDLGADVWVSGRYMFD
jgi:hypothetical protein